ncbi:MAG TPA: HAD family hydrolase [Chthoniobacterales bacterium]|nr:HAD family hydrolase [Chthoniobacterales bacterium]
MIRTILFDMGGTLDGDGLHWLERFLALYRECGIDLPRETIRLAFDEAERLAATDEKIANAGLAEMIAQHVRWQTAHLGLNDPELERRLTQGFIEPVRAATLGNVRMLATLQERGFELGVVSNGCGNVDKLAADFGYAPYLDLIVDSRRVGLFKPDPAIYRFAVDKLGREPAEIMMVGDSFERDIEPAKEIGMKTAWLEGAESRECPDPTLVDIRLRRLADLANILSSPALALA